MLKKRNLLAWPLALVVALVFALPVTAAALDLRQGDSVSVPKGSTLSDDLYAFGNTITIDGTVDGDVVAFGQIVVINGEVRGSVITAAQTVRIDGVVDGSVRAAGAMVDVSGRVDGDVLAAANQATVSGDVKRDLAAGAQSVSITGSVGRNVMTGSESLSIAGRVGGNVEAQTTRVTVPSQGSVDGNLNYWSADEADVRGDVSGTTTRHEPPTQDRRSKDGNGVASAILGAVLAWVQSFVGVLLLGVLMVFALRRPMQGGSQAVADRPLPSAGVGLLVFFAAPMAAGFVFFVGLFIGAWWLAFVALAVYWLLLLSGLIVGSLALGRAILRNARAAGEPALAWSLLLGLVLVWVAAAVPFLGWLAAWAVTIVGTGALVLLWMGKSQKPVVATAVAAPEITAPPIEPPRQ